MFTFIFTFIFTLLFAFTFTFVEGYFWTALNCAATAAFVLYMPKAMSVTKLSSLEKVFYNNIISIPLIGMLHI